MADRRSPFIRGLTLKRCLDVVASAVLLVCVAPVLAVCGLAVYIETGRPWLFTQVRSGLGGRPFKIVKLRTLRRDVACPEELGQIDAASPGVTRVGRFLRRYKLDEFPQLWNVLRGEMSLVGPRPTLPEQVAAYSSVQRRRLDRLPGLTGLAQVSGGTTLTWDDRICLDIWYVDHQSFGSDLQIIARTIGVLAFGERRDDCLLYAARIHVGQWYSTPPACSRPIVRGANPRSADVPSTATRSPTNAGSAVQ